MEKVRKLPGNSLIFVLRELEDIISRSSAQKSNVKVKSFGFFTSDSKKSEVQDLLDSILKIAYPYISQARKLTDMTKQVEYSSSGNGLKFSLLPEALPVGYEDKTPVIIGFQTNKIGIKSVVKVQVWRGNQSVYCEYKDVMFSKPITGETAPVKMEDAVCHRPLTISATGKALAWWSGWFGDFTITGEEHEGRLVYKNSEEPPAYIFSEEDGTWAVSSVIGYSQPVVRSIKAAVIPTLCCNWEYQDKKHNWYQGDITVRVK